MKLPVGVPGFQSLQDIAGYLRSLAGSVQAGWNVEHKEDGGHAIRYTNAVFDAGDYTATSGTWTVTEGQMFRNQLVYLGGLTIWNFSIIGGTLAGGLGNELRIRIPFRIRATHGEFMGNTWMAGDTGANGPALGFIFSRKNANADKVGLFKADLSAFAASTNFGVTGYIIFDGEKY